MKREASIRASMRPGGTWGGGALTNNGQELPDVCCQITTHDLPVEYVLGERMSVRTLGCPSNLPQTGRHDLKKHPSFTHHLQLKIGSPNLLQDGCRWGESQGKSHEALQHVI